MNPYIAAAGIGLSAYGANEQANQAQKQYELAVQAWQAEMDRQARMDEQNQQQQYFANALTTAQYGQGVKKNNADAYSAYARSVGI